MDFINDARNLNSDLGRHVKKCSFSSSLSGRFYKNSSLENHMASKRKVAMMKKKKRQLEKALKIEDQRIKILEGKLKEKEWKRQEKMEFRLQQEQAATCLQTLARRNIAMEKLEILKIEAEIVKFVALFCQAAFRGRKGRQRAGELRRRIIQHQKETSASTRIQALARRKIARKILDEKHRYMILCQERAATRIQSLERGRWCRYHLMLEADLKKRKNNSAVLIQAQFRGLLGRQFAKEKRESMKLKVLQVKPENDHESVCSSKKKDRLPLHERRYSTYSVGIERRGSLRSQVPKVIRRNSYTMNERNWHNHHRDSKKVLITSEEKSMADQSQSNKHRCQDSEVGKKSMDRDVAVTEHDKTQRTPNKVVLAQQKAAARVAEMERKARIAEMKTIENAQAASERKAELEAKQRELLCLEKRRKERRQSAKTIPKHSKIEPIKVLMDNKQYCAQSSNDNNAAHNVAKGKNILNVEVHPLGTQEPVSHDKEDDPFLPVPVFDDSFEDDFISFTEHEDDLG